MTSTDPQTIADAVTTLKKSHPKIHIISSTDSFLTATCQRTPTAHVRVKITLTFPDGYRLSSGDTSSMVVAIEGGVNVAPGLRRKLEKELGEVQQQEPLQGSIFRQIDAVLKRLVEFVDGNRFVPCWKELRQVVELINDSDKGTSGDAIRLVESKGLIRLAFQPKGKYQYKCSITVDPDYPNTSQLVNYGKPCRLQLDSTTIPAQIEKVVTTQAQELVRRLQDGMSEDQALIMSNPVHLPLSEGRGKNDDETPAQQWEREENGRLAMYGISGGPYDGSHPQSSLLSLVTFLRRSLYELANQSCPLCQKKCLPVDDPTELASLYKATAKPVKRRGRLARVHCGHWYHYGCLDTLMNEPPLFGIGYTCSCGEGSSCCGKPLYHHDWSEKAAKERERAYTQRQAREREIADAASCF